MKTFYLKDVKKASYPISITTYPESTRVSIGGTPIGKTPINTRLDYGTYTLSFELDGYKKN